jgi:hypothetical protein
MSEKSSGLDFDRQVFVQPQAAARPPAAPFAGVLFAFAAIAVLVFLGYKLLPQLMTKDFGSTKDPAVADLDKRLGEIDRRLDRLEASHRAEVAARKSEPVESKTIPRKPVVKTVYQISPAPPRAVRSTQPPAQDLATARRMSALQGGEVANREAWQATTDKLADMAGQVGIQSVAILRNQDELNQLLARSEMEAIPFELRRRANPQPVGPVSLVLKDSNSKRQRYTLCVYVQPACIELKDRALHEVVQFVASRNTAPLQVIATKIMKNEILGYLEVPRNQNQH